MKTFFMYTQMLVITIALLWIIIVQGQTIAQQRSLINDMTKNPACMLP